MPNGSRTLPVRAGTNWQNVKLTAQVVCTAYVFVEKFKQTHLFFNNFASVLDHCCVFPCCQSDASLKCRACEEFSNSGFIGQKNSFGVLPSVEGKYSFYVTCRGAGSLCFRLWYLYYVLQCMPRAHNQWILNLLRLTGYRQYKWTYNLVSYVTLNESNGSPVYMRTFLECALQRNLLS